MKKLLSAVACLIILSPLVRAQDNAAPPASDNAPAPSRERARDAAKPEVVELKSGLQYIDLVVGDGPEAQVGYRVRVHYKGELEDGTVFDSSAGRDPFTFKLGMGEVIDGWDQGVKGMKVGGKRKLIVPAKLGYGKRGVAGTIPPNATLIFEVELLDVR